MLGAVQLDAAEQQAAALRHDLHQSIKQVEELSRKLYKQKPKVCILYYLLLCPAWHHPVGKLPAGCNTLSPNHTGIGKLYG